MPNLTVSNPASGTLIKDIAAGEFFNYPVSALGNTGFCVRVKDSKVGKNRFANLHTGKLLTAEAGDRGQILPEGTTLTIG